MIIYKYGIELHRVTHDDIELIRQMRNRDDIRSKMLDQRLITPEQQEKWFQSINNSENLYFVIFHNNTKIGLVYGKNINHENKTAEGGIFIWDQSYLGTGIPAKASILMMELSFEVAGMEKIYAKVNELNSLAINYNKSLGYVEIEKGKLMILSKDSYKKRILKLKRYLI